MKQFLFAVLSIFGAAILLPATTNAQNTYPQAPFQVVSIKGNVTAIDGHPVQRYNAVHSLSSLLFSNTSDVVVVSDRYQRNFYVMPGNYTSADSGRPCAGGTCDIVVKDGLGNVIVTYQRSETGYSVVYGKSEAPAPVAHHTTVFYRPVRETTPRYEETSVVESVRTPKTTGFKVLSMRRQ
jgi:hypothetical protein